MFRFHKTLDVITLFHKAGSPASIRAQTLLKQISANATEYATEDQASDHTAQAELAKRTDFELEVTEQPPTEDQLKSILDYIGSGKTSSVIKGASSASDALKTFKLDQDSFQRPVIVDWSNGKAVAGGSESEILKLVEELKK